MPILGAHMSIAGGYWRAAQSAGKVGCKCVQIFTKNNNQWRAKPLVDEDAQLFRDELKKNQIELNHTLSHASYLINLASPKPDLLAKSKEALVIELQRADFLGVPHVVFHPGSHTTSSPEQGIQTITESLNEILEKTKDLSTIPLLENTAGQGSNLGWQFEHLGQIIQGVKDSDRVGVCIDTCHTFAAGYALAPKIAYEATIQEMEMAFGIEKIFAFHLNDSKRPFGSRKDRHEHIGSGEMGTEPFRLLLNDERFTHIPMYLETEKGELDDGTDMDVMNLELLHSLVQN